MLQLVCAAPEELAVAMGLAVQCPAPASFGEGQAEGEIWHPEHRSPQSSPADLWKGGSVLNASVEESDSSRSRINKNLFHQKQEPGMTWYVKGFGKGGVKGWQGSVFTAACQENQEWVWVFGVLAEFSMRRFDRSRLQCMVSCFF